MGRFIPEKVIDEVIERADLVDIISSYIRLEKKGKNYLGLCPFHAEKTPSLSVSPDKNLFYCFGCGTGGNAITFLMKMENYTFQEAVETLAKREGIHLSLTNKNIENQSKNLYQLNHIASKFYSHILWHHKNASGARQYLKERGLTREVAERFCLGYAPDSWRSLSDFMNKRGFKQENLEEAGLIIKKGPNNYYDRFRHRLIFPIHDSRGRIVGFGGRQLPGDDRGPKYLNSPETKIFKKGKLLYGFNRGIGEIRKSNRAIIVEGYMDVIACHQFGITNAVASLGTSFTDEQAALIKRNCDEVIIAYDADAAGVSATLKGLSILNKAGCKVKVLIMPKGSDPDDYLRREGKDAFLRSLEEKIQDLIDFKLGIAVRENDITLPEGKSAALRFVIGDIAVIENAVERHEAIRKTALKLQITEGVIEDELRKFYKLQKIGTRQDKKVNIRHNTKENGQLTKSTILQSEKVLLKYILEDINVYYRVKEELDYNLFSGEIKEILKAADDIFEESGEIPPVILLNRLNDKNSALLSSILTSEEKFPVSIDQCIDIFKLQAWQRQEQKLLKELSDAEQKDNEAAVKSLVRQINQLQKAIQNMKNKIHGKL